MLSCKTIDALRATMKIGVLVIIATGKVKTLPSKFIYLFELTIVLGGYKFTIVIFFQVIS